MYLIKSFTRIRVNSHVQPSNEKMLMYWRIEAWCNHGTMPAVLSRLQGTQAQDASQLHLRFYLAILQTCTPIWQSKLENLINLPFCYVGCFTRLQDTSKRITEHSLRNNHPHSEPIQWKKLLNVECQLWNCAKFPTLKHGNSRYHLSVLFRYLLNKSREHLILTRKEKTICAIQIHSKLQKNIDRKGYESLFWHGAHASMHEVQNAGTWNNPNSTASMQARRAQMRAEQTSKLTIPETSLLILVRFLRRQQGPRYSSCGFNPHTRTLPVT